ncbi:hypothetical protein NM208_g12458 [Fusarium decemcellulare]|uniref:Uncharacterized protein n=1 Tax=Fusarium decemcellulare TaxID=57161 RepID=A0ACC1RP62_9HYPO|nr:hypothetical protein NM208_g12458 [Fusarium decemcellulare]
MARIKSAKKSVGGKAPRKILRGGATHRQFQDHAGRPYTVVAGFPGPQHIVVKLGIQLYFLGSPSPSPEAFGDKFLNSDAISGWGNACNYWPRVDVYTGFGSVEECIEHHHREKAFRKRAIEEMRRDAVVGLSEEDAAEKLATEVQGKEPLPHIVPSWCPSERFWTSYCSDDRYRSWILVVPEDRHSWEDVIEKGLLQVRFDLDVTPLMETEMEDEFEECTLEKEKYGWVYVDRSGLEQLKPVQCRLLCAREQPRDLRIEPNLSPEKPREAMFGWRTPGSKDSLRQAWSRATLALWDCTYRKEYCEDCNEGEPHNWCPTDRSEHYFDEDGQCVACRRALEYRRRSKRVAAQGQRKTYGP